MNGEPCLYVEVERPRIGGSVAVLISECDVPFFMSQRWYANTNQSGSHWLSGGKRGHVYFHRAILNAPEGIEVDHINGDGWDNRRENLRLCNSSQNKMNQGKHYLPKKIAHPKGGYKSSVYKGVWWDKKGWNAKIYAHGRKEWLGRFKTDVEAALAYNEAARRLHGEFARLNDTRVKS